MAIQKSNIFHDCSIDIIFDTEIINAFLFTFQSPCNFEPGFKIEFFKFFHHFPFNQILLFLGFVIELLQLNRPEHINTNQAEAGLDLFFKKNTQQIFSTTYDKKLTAGQVFVICN